MLRHDGQFHFEDMPLKIDGQTIAYVTGECLYEVNGGSGDVISIDIYPEVSGEDGVTISINDKADPTKWGIFLGLSEAIEDDERFHEEIWEWRQDNGQFGVGA